MKPKSKRTAKLKKPRLNGSESEALNARLLSGRINGKETAQLAGLSEQRVSQLRRAGLTPAEIVAGVRLRHGNRTTVRPVHNVHNAVNNLKVNGHISNTDGRSLATDDRSLVDLQKAKLSVEIDSKNMDLAERRGALVEWSKVQLIVQLVCAQNSIAVRELLSLPATLRDDCGYRPAPQIEELFHREIERVLAKLQADNMRALGELEVAWTQE